MSMMPRLMPSAPAGAAAHLTPSTEDGLSGYWNRMDVRDASTLTEDEFEREYMNKGLPVVIRNDPGALAVSRRINVSTLLESCGDREPELGRRLVEPLKALPSVIKLELSRRLYETHGVTLSQAVKIMEGRGKIKTLRDFFQSEYFATVETAQDPRFPRAKKDYSHPADYLWPPSIHSWPVHDNCPRLLDMMEEAADLGEGAGPGDGGDGGIGGDGTATGASREQREQRARRLPTKGSAFAASPRLGYVPRISAPLAPKEVADLYLFASGDRSRAYHPHIHGSPNHVLLLLLHGKKRAVVWPRDQAPRLYPFMGDGDVKANEIGEKTPIFMANGFEVDLKWQPALAAVKGGLEGVAGPGDLLYVPCGSVHSLGNLGNMFAVGWIPTHVPGQNMRDCPNRNGRGYRDVGT